MFSKLLSAFLVLIVSACGSKSSPKGETTTLSLQDQVKERITSIRNWATTCQYTPEFKGISKDTCRARGDAGGDGDSALFAGLLCLSGEQIGCDTVKKSQASDGRFWRSPARAEMGEPEGDSFSRDMLLGVVGYLVRTRDKEAAERWYSYIESIDYKLCPDASDTRCTLTPATWGLLKETWKYLGLTPSYRMTIYGILDEASIELAAKTVPTGYRLHLVVTEVLLHQKLGTYTESLARAVRTAASRQPDNPYFKFVAEGPSDEILKLILAQAPKEQPKTRDEWSIERDTAEQKWNNSMGWEFIFLSRLVGVQ